MKKYIIITPVLLILLFGCLAFINSGRKQQVKIRGSETLYPLCFALIDTYLNDRRNVKFDLKSEGSEIGISALKRRETDIALSSRPLNVGEKVYLQEGNIKYREVIVAYDALAIVVNKHNKVTSLDNSQVSDIFSGRITNWNQLGGEDHPIYVYTRDPNSGTYNYFNSLFLNTGSPVKSAIPVTENYEIINKVKENKYAISYIGLGYLNEEVKGISISMDKKNYILPNWHNVQSLLYPVIRPLYIYALAEDNQKVKDFVEYALSAKGQQVVMQSNYIPVRNTEVQMRHIAPVPF